MVSAIIPPPYWLLICTLSLSLSHQGRGDIRSVGIIHLLDSRKYFPGGGAAMARMDFALWDSMGYAEMQRARTADVYEEHIRLAQIAEETGHHSYFTIEHQNSDV